MAKKYLFVIVSFIYAVMIFYLSSISSPPNPVPSSLFLFLHRKMVELGVEFLGIPFYFVYRYPDKFAHMMLYMGFGLVLNPAIRSTVGRQPELLSIIIGAIYGASDEYHQSFVPYRSASTSDLMADVAGLVLSQILLIAVGRLRVAK
ncbi:VanZ family protein [Archaeoglobus neptunius]|uniref:VanZ family protein n=1 Tax=Archaeoglobus neptunius TaxID=2798580 RepID=UPI0019271498|nr:VanZ family protein [Archaeoglobus neptunius]